MRRIDLVSAFADLRYYLGKRLAALDPEEIMIILTGDEIDQTRRSFEEWEAWIGKAKAVLNQGIRPIK